MGILPKYRGKGLGHRLATDTIRAATDAGMERIELEVFASNERAIALYRKRKDFEWQRAEPSLEDVFIDLMSRARDNFQ